MAALYNLDSRLQGKEDKKRLREVQVMGFKGKRASF